MKHTDLVAFMRAARLTVNDETALTGKELYPETLMCGNRVYMVGARLCKTIQVMEVEKNV